MDCLQTDFFPTGRKTLKNTTPKQPDHPHDPAVLYKNTFSTLFYYSLYFEKECSIKKATVGTVLTYLVC